MSAEFVTIQIMQFTLCLFATYKLVLNNLYNCDVHANLRTCTCV